jgi:hypothetical protein
MTGEIRVKTFLASGEREDLVFFVLIEGAMAVIFNCPIGKLACAPDQTSLFGTFFAHEEEAGGLAAIGPRKLFLVIPGAGKIGDIGNRKPHSSVRLNNVDSLRGDDAKVQTSQKEQGGHDSRHKIELKDARVHSKGAADGKNPLENLLAIFMGRPRYYFALARPV